MFNSLIFVEFFNRLLAKILECPLNPPILGDFELMFPPELAGALVRS
jgi:hypothetical protein